MIPACFHGMCMTHNKMLFHDITMSGYLMCMDVLLGTKRFNQLHFSNFKYFKNFQIMIIAEHISL